MYGGDVRPVLLAALLEPLPVLEERVERRADALDAAAAGEVERRLAGRRSARSRPGTASKPLPVCCAGVRTPYWNAPVSRRASSSVFSARSTTCASTFSPCRARLEQELQRRRGHERRRRPSRRVRAARVVPAAAALDLRRLRASSTSASIAASTSAARSVGHAASPRAAAAGSPARRRGPSRARRSPRRSRASMQRIARAPSSTKSSPRSIACAHAAPPASPRRGLDQRRRARSPCRRRGSRSGSSPLDAVHALVRPLALLADRLASARSDSWQLDQRARCRASSASSISRSLGGLGAMRRGAAALSALAGRLRRAVSTQAGEARGRPASEQRGGESCRDPRTRAAALRSPSAAASHGARYCSDRLAGAGAGALPGPARRRRGRLGLGHVLLRARRALRASRAGGCTRESGLMPYVKPACLATRRARRPSAPRPWPASATYFAAVDCVFAPARSTRPAPRPRASRVDEVALELVDARFSTASSPAAGLCENAMAAHEHGERQRRRHTGRRSGVSIGAAARHEALHPAAEAPLGRGPRILYSAPHGSRPGPAQARSAAPVHLPDGLHRPPGLRDRHPAPAGLLAGLRRERDRARAALRELLGDAVRLRADVGAPLGPHRAQAGPDRRAARHGRRRTCCSRTRDSLPMLFASRAAGRASSARTSRPRRPTSPTSRRRENRAKGMGLIGAAFGLGFTLGPLHRRRADARLGPPAPGYFAAGLSLAAATLRLRSRCASRARARARLARIFGLDQVARARSRAAHRHRCSC